MFHNGPIVVGNKQISKLTQSSGIYHINCQLTILQVCTDLRDPRHFVLNPSSNAISSKEPHCLKHFVERTISSNYSFVENGLTSSKTV